MRANYHTLIEWVWGDTSEIALFYLSKIKYGHSESSVYYEYFTSIAQYAQSQIRTPLLRFIRRSCCEFEWLTKSPNLTGS